MPQLPGCSSSPPGCARSSRRRVPTRAARPAFLAALGTGVDHRGVHHRRRLGVGVGQPVRLHRLAVRAAGAGRADGPSRPGGALLWQQAARTCWPVWPRARCSLLAYGLVLWAQARGALAPIAALRETSVIFGAIIATLVFREPFGRTRIAATVLVAAGIVLLNVS